MVGLAPLNRTKGVEDFGRLEYSSAFFVVGLNIFVDVEISALILPWSSSLLNSLSLLLSLSFDRKLSLSLSFDSTIEWKFCS